MDIKIVKELPRIRTKNDFEIEKFHQALQNGVVELTFKDKEEAHRKTMSLYQLKKSGKLKVSKVSRRENKVFLVK